MIFNPTGLKGAYIIELEKRSDERGFFSRAWCRKEFEKHGLVQLIVQSNLSYSRKKGTLRGMHFQTAPFEETKVVQCVRGALYDVIIDLRPDSETFSEWISIVLNADDHKMIYVPRGFAHGFMTLQDDTEAFYHVSQFYSPGNEGGVRWNDPAFNITWPEFHHLVISDKDRNWPDFNKKSFLKSTGVAQC